MDRPPWDVTAGAGVDSRSPGLPSSSSDARSPPAGDAVSSQAQQSQQSRPSAPQDSSQAPAPQDTAPRDLAPQALDDIAERYTLLTQSIFDGLFDWDLTAGTLYLSPLWKAQLGFEDDELENRVSTWEEHLHPEDREATLTALRAFLDSPARTWDREFRMRHRSGEYRWIRARAHALRDDYSGKARRLLGVHVDVDDHHRRERTTEQHREIIEAIFYSLPDIFFLLDSRGLILDCHSGWGAPFYADPAEFLGKPVTDVLPPEASLGLASAVQEALLVDSLITREYTLDMPDRRRYYEARIRAGRDRQHVSVVVRDITQSHESELELQQRLNELSGLYRVFQLMQTEGEIETLSLRAATHLVRAVPGDGHSHCLITIDGHTQAAGDASARGRRLRAPLFDGRGSRGELLVQLPAAVQAGAEEQRLVNGAAQAIGLRLQNDRSREEIATYQRIVSNTQDQVALLDRQLHYRVVNAAYAARSGLTPEHFIGRSVAEMLGDSYSDESRARLQRALAGEQLKFQEWRDSIDGRCFMSVLYSPYRIGDQVAGVVISSHDISELHAAQEQLRRAAQVFSNTIEAVMMTRLDGTIIDVNEAFTEISGFSRDEALGQRPSLLRSRRHDTDFFTVMFEALAQTGRWRGEIWNCRRSGEEFPCLMTIAVVEDERGRPNGYVSVFSDITYLKENERRLEVLAHHDQLTGLPNRSQLSRVIERNIEAAHRNGSPFTVMFIDLDHFKDVNDTLGHNAGDQLLRSAAQRLSALLRANDVLARVGGDEFVAVLPGMHSAGNASLIAGKIIDALTRAFTIDDQDVRISCSVGIASYPEDGADADTLLRNADAAMYQAKQGGRADWRCYSPEMTERAARHLFIISELRRALEVGELRICYEPQYRVDSDELRGLEARPLWEHPVHGLIDQREFLEAAEEGGLIRRLDYWALDTVCEHLHRWHGSGMTSLVVGINISSRTLEMKHFADEVAERLRDNGIPGSALELELSEAALLGELQENRPTLARLAALGVRVAIDKFGSGVSSLMHLRQKPVRRLKIDASFVRQIPDDPDSTALTEAAVALGRSLGLEVVAEGLQNQRQLEYLRCHDGLLVQGPFYGDALGADDILDSADPRGT